jgi:3-oxoacyl-[acyl-carrier protein] reductase
LIYSALIYGALVHDALTCGALIHRAGRPGIGCSAQTCYNFDMSFSQQTGGVSLSLEDKVVLVTGGSRGIGAATVRLLRQAGARVVFSYRSAELQAAEVAAACGGDEVCRALRQELATVEDGQALVAAAAAVFGRLDCLVVNHGIWPAHDQPIATMSATQWRGTLGVNLDSVFGLVQAAVAQMLGQASADVPKAGPFGRLRAGYGAPVNPTHDDRAVVNGAPGNERGDESGVECGGGTGAERGEVHGQIVLIASTAAQRGEAFHADYAASKGALISLTKSLSSELAPQGILCNCVAPGWVRTEMSEATLNDPIVAKKALGLIPLGRPAEPEEIAGPVVFLCTKWAGFVSGEVFNVNGGAVLVG